MSLVQRICQHQGWRVTLDSAPGRGCRFRIDLRDEPAAPGASNDA
ncbi:ATP-binding protein [Burkholderia anthina]